MTRQCCVCKRIHVDGRWVAPPWNIYSDPNVTHGYCERCYDDLMRSLGRSAHEIRRVRLQVEAAQ